MGVPAAVRARQCARTWSTRDHVGVRADCAASGSSAVKYLYSNIMHSKYGSRRGVSLCLSVLTEHSLTRDISSLEVLASRSAHPGHATHTHWSTEHLSRVIFTLSARARGIAYCIYLHSYICTYACGLPPSAAGPRPPSHIDSHTRRARAIACLRGSAHTTTRADGRPARRPSFIDL